jgi:hypothetical protein
MRTRETFRLSNTVTFSLSPELYAQLRAPTTIDNIFEKRPTRGAVVRLGLASFLHDTNKSPPDLTPLLKTSNPLLPKRTRSLSVSITSSELRQQLDDYANTHNLTASAVLRRAAYEQTKPAEPNPTATIDAWGDAPKG